MKKLHLRFEFCVLTLLLVVVVLPLTGCTKKPAHSSIDANNILFDIQPCKAADIHAQHASSAEIACYGGQIQSAIAIQFPDASSWAGKICTLRINIAPDGSLNSVKAENGDTAFCQAVLTAVKKADFPKPPSRAVYEVFKNIPLDFKP